MRETKETLNHAKCLIAGYGRIGKVLAKMLHGLGANVTVCARKDVYKRQDSTPASRKMMEIGLIKVIICQQPFRQGNRAVHVAVSYTHLDVNKRQDCHCHCTNTKNTNNCFFSTYYMINHKITYLFQREDSSEN